MDLHLRAPHVSTEQRLTEHWSDFTLKYKVGAYWEVWKFSGIWKP